MTHHSRRVLVTGASRGTGAAIAKAFAATGAGVALAARNRQALERVMAEITAAGGSAEIHAVDLSTRRACRELAARCGEIDVLINNAAVTNFTRDTVLTPDDAYWDLNFAVDFFAPLVLMQELGRGMVARGRGVILNISSMAAQRPGPRNAPYAAAKSALDTLSKAAGMELAAMGSGVRVNSIALGHIDTEAFLENVGKGLTPADVARRNSPLGRLITAQEVAAFCVYLASDEAAPILGTVLNIDGGLTAGSYSFAQSFGPDAVVPEGAPAVSNDVPASPDHPGDPLKIAVEAYIWGFPRMLYEKYLIDFRAAGAAFNRFFVMDRMATPNHGGVNVDTLYGVAWLDLEAEPIVLEVGDAHDRYYSVQLVDVYANNFAYLGRRTTGTGARRFLIAGPGWQGVAPPEMSVIRAPSRRVFAFLRTLIDDEADVAVANEFDRQVAISALSTYPDGLVGAALMEDLGPYFPHRHSYLDKLGAAYFDRLGDALASDPPGDPPDVAAMQRFAALGVGPGKHPTEHGPASGALLAEAVRLGNEKIFAASANKVLKGWSINLNFDSGERDPLFKATVNRYGIGMVGPEEAIYLMPAALTMGTGAPVPTWTSMGPDGEPLTGARCYRLRFPPGELPKVDAFWSLTMYDDDLMLVQNPIGRFAIGDRTPGLVFSPDGSLEIFIQHQRPESGTSNWLPAPPGRFEMIFRAYQPQSAFLTGEYQLPPLEIVDRSSHVSTHRTHGALSVPDLLERARDESGLRDYGTSGFIPSLRKLVESVNSVLDQLHDKGRVGIEDRIVRLLVNRLRMQRDIEQHPEILSEKLLPLAAIIGLPRTGTTKLQRLLAAGQGFNELLMWQAFNPAPFPASEKSLRDPRIQAAADFIAWVARDAPDSHKGHTMIVEGAEEEHHLLEQTFETPSIVSFLPVYSWCRYIGRVDKTDAYAHLFRCLQYLQWQFHRHDAKPWLLKYPANLGNETYIDRNFPGMRYVVTHRDPFPVMASLSRLNNATQLLYCHPQDLTEFSRWALDEFSSEVERHLAWREANPAAPVLDVSFGEIVKHGFDAAHRIYDFLGLPWTSETQSAIRLWLVENEQQKDKLQYSLEDVGFSEAVCRARFADYYERFSHLL